MSMMIPKGVSQPKHSMGPGVGERGQSVLSEKDSAPIV